MRRVLHVAVLILLFFLLFRINYIHLYFVIRSEQCQIIFTRAYTYWNVRSIYNFQWLSNKQSSCEFSRNLLVQLIEYVLHTHFLKCCKRFQQISNTIIICFARFHNGVPFRYFARVSPLINFGDLRIHWALMRFKLRDYCTTQVDSGLDSELQSCDCTKGDPRIVYGWEQERNYCSRKRWEKNSFDKNLNDQIINIGNLKIN